MISTAGWKAQGAPVRNLHRNNFQRKDFVGYQWSRTRGRRIHHSQTGANSGADQLLSGFSGLENSVRKGDGRDGGSLQFPNPCCDQVLFAVAVPTIVDRLVQQCILQVMEPICEAKFYERSNGFRPNRSAENAIAQCYKMINLQKLYFVVDVDIKGFFDNVNHTKLIQQIWHMGIRDKKLLCIIREMLKAPIVMPDGTVEYPEKGTPQGGILSPLLSNIVLNELDWWIASQWENMPTRYEYSCEVRPNGTINKTAIYGAFKNTTKLKEVHIIRYADDFKLFAGNEAMQRKYLSL